MKVDSLATRDDDTDGYGYGDPPAELLNELREEVVHAADDVDRLTEQLHDRSVMIERLEVLTGELLGLLTVPAAVVDAEGRIVAVSLGAIHSTQGIQEDSLGEQASAVLPRQLADDIAAVARAATAEHGAGLKPGNDTEHPDVRWARVSGAKVLTLPGGWALAVLST